MPTKKNRRVAQDLSPATGKPQSPAFITPMAAVVVKALPEGDDWIYELKLDGSPYIGLEDHERVVDLPA